MALYSRRSNFELLPYTFLHNKNNIKQPTPEKPDAYRGKTRSNSEISSDLFSSRLQCVQLILRDSTFGEVWNTFIIAGFNPESLFAPITFVESFWFLVSSVEARSLCMPLTWFINRFLVRKFRCTLFEIACFMHSRQTDATRMVQNGCHNWRRCITRWDGASQAGLRHWVYDSVLDRKTCRSYNFFFILLIQPHAQQPGSSRHELDTQWRSPFTHTHTRMGLRVFSWNLRYFDALDQSGDNQRFNIQSSIQQVQPHGWFYCGFNIVQHGSQIQNAQRFGSFF